MENKFLFDKIRVEEDGNVRFVPYRNAAHTYENVKQEIAEFIPNSFPDFLKMLQKTKIDEMGKYNITLCVDGKEEAYSFYSLIDYFASKIYMYNHSMHLSTVGRFINKAYIIKELAVKEQRELIEETPTTIE